MKDPWDETSMEKDIPEEGLSDRDRVTVTMKAGAGFDASWVVLHAKDVDEANRLLDDIDIQGLHGKVIASASRFQALNGPSKSSTAPSGGYQKSSSYRPTQSVSPPPHGAPSAVCPQHGAALVYNEPFMSGGKEISGRMSCPERGCRAITIWHNKDGSWKQQA